jgi:hypothetical protein
MTPICQCVDGRCAITVVLCDFRCCPPRVRCFICPSRSKYNQPINSSVSPQLAVELIDESLAALREHLCVSPDAHKYDLIDLVDVLSGLGCRIGELFALDWTKY